MRLKVLHLYNDIMDLYGDKGNMMCLKYRCEMRGIEFVYDTCTIGEIKDFSSYNLIFMGGGADKEQAILSKDLLLKKNYIKKAIDSRSFFLLICGGYQLFGKYYIDANDNKIDGLGLLNYKTEKSKNNDRCIGNIHIIANLDGEDVDIVGFENHGGQTYFENCEDYFGKVIFGSGNHYKSSYEGYYKDNILGTYIHGPLLPKNPKLADFIIKKSLEKEYGNIVLKKLDDTMEENAMKELLDNIILISLF